MTPPADALASLGELPGQQFDELAGQQLAAGTSGIATTLSATARRRR
jgi:hypothetical protein